MTKLEAAIRALGHWLLHLDGGFEILLLVGLSMSLAHLFALVANKLTPRQIVFQLLLDALVLLPLSNWNKARLAGGVRRQVVAGMGHNGQTGPFSPRHRPAVVSLILRSLAWIDRPGSAAPAQTG